MRGLQYDFDRFFHISHRISRFTGCLNKKAYKLSIIDTESYYGIIWISDMKMEHDE